MSTNSTTSNYISKIDQQFPVAGKNNDSSGFRDNFKNIKSALTSADQDISSLKLNSVKLIGTNDFNNSVIKRVILQNSSVMVYDDSTNIQTGDIQLDYANGNYQKIKICDGTHMITVANWPAGTQSASMILSVITSSATDAYVDFNAVNLVSLGPDPLPVMLTANTEQFFELWCDGNANNLFVRGLGSKYVPSTPSAGSITPASVTSYTIDNNVYTTGKGTDNQYATIVTANGKAGNLALVPNQIKVQILNIPVLDVLGDTVAKTFPVSSTAGVMVGASINFPESINTSINTSTFVVTDFTRSTITVDPAFNVLGIVAGDYVTITNPRFTEQPTVVTVAPMPITTTTSVVGDFKGQLYATSSTVYVTYKDYAFGTTNKIKISGDNTMVTQPVTIKSTALATTEFVHNIMPYGAIIMWHGAVDAIPTGWALCDGTNPTPNLVDRFVVGAGSTYAVAATGGSADAVVVKHTHISTSTVTDPEHLHAMPYSSGQNSPKSTDYTEGEYGGKDSTTNTASTATGITVATTIGETGVAGTNANLPPYYALCYIMKVTGSVV